MLIPFIPLVPAFEAFNAILGIYAKEADDRVRQQIDEAMLGQDELEKHLQEEDSHGLVKLVRYSRLQLQAYYRVIYYKISKYARLYLIHFVYN